MGHGGKSPGRGWNREPQNWQNPWVMEDYISGLWTMESCNEELSLPSPPSTESEELTYGGHYHKHEKQQKGWRGSSVVEREFA